MVSFRVLEMIPDPSNFLMDIGISLNLHLEDVEARSSTYYIDMAIPTDYSMTENSVGFPKRKVSRQWIASHLPFNYFVYHLKRWPPLLLDTHKGKCKHPATSERAELTSPISQGMSVNLKIITSHWATSSGD